MRLSRLLASAAVLLLALDSQPLAGQELSGIVRDSATRQPVPGAVVMVIDALDGVVARHITNQRGEFRVALPASGKRLRVVRLGFRPRVLPVPVVNNGLAQLDVVITAIPITLEAVQTVVAARCPQRNDGAAALALLEQARTGLLATVVSRSVKPANMKRLLYDRHMDGNSERIAHQSVRIDSATTAGSFGAERTAADFVQHGFVQDSGGIRTFFAPDAETLLDDGFASGYCFRIMDGEPSRLRQIGLGFTVADRQRGRIDIEGALWIDTVARALVDIGFRYVGLDRPYEEFHPGGRVSFQAMPNGVVLVDRWALRLVGVREDTVTVRVRRLESQQRAVARYFAQEIGGELARAVWNDGTRWTGALGTLRVHAVADDGLPARHTELSLNDTGYIGATDSTGTLEIVDLLPGPYDLYVIDPDLAPLGISLQTGMTFTAARDSTVQLQLAVPTAVGYAAQECASEQGRAGTAWILGRVTTPDGRAVEGAKILIQKSVAFVGWVEVGEGGSTGNDGTFHNCKLGLGTLVRVIAQHAGATDASHVQALTQRLTIFTLELKPRN